MTSTAGLGLANLLVAGAGVPAAAHELRPGYLELRETTVDRYHVVWKQPARGDLRLAIDPVFPPPAGSRAAGATGRAGRLHRSDDDRLPYSSAHIDGVESGLVVHPDHSTQGRPETIEEVRRILRLHAGLR